ncbi:hypothetical protein V6N12_029672 [Hibiscus sabdariffa]|uniref:Uncharacterized protein n=1 Tax=Hibiscus sabdariffa TaxID=183260 RepID=A0ABR2CXB9_9ROSI
MEGNCWKPTEPMGLSHPLQEQGFYQLVSIQNPFAFFQQHGMWEGPNFYPVPASPDDSLVKHVLKALRMFKTGSAFKDGSGEGRGAGANCDNPAAILQPKACAVPTEPRSIRIVGIALGEMGREHDNVL